MVPELAEVGDMAAGGCVELLRGIPTAEGRPEELRERADDK